MNDSYLFIKLRMLLFQITKVQVLLKTFKKLNLKKLFKSQKISIAENLINKFIWLGINK